MSFPGGQPSLAYRYAFKLGMSGFDVGALQINLRAAGFDLAPDGTFGTSTETAVRAYQLRNKLLIDGIAGMRTQQSLCLTLTSPAQARYRTPGGLMRGVCEGESGFAVAAVSGPNGNNTYDYGPYQDSLSAPGEASTADLIRAFDAEIMADETAKKIRLKKDSYYGKAGAQTHERAWQLAILYHNYPYAADRMAAGKNPNVNGSDSWSQWVVDIGVNGVTTVRQWCEYYISSKVIYCKNWTT